MPTDMARPPGVMRWRSGDDLLCGLNQRFGLVEGKAAQQHGAWRNGLGRGVGSWRFVEKAAGQKLPLFLINFMI